MKNNKGIASILIILIVVGALAAGGYYFWSKNSQKQVACTMDAKICPDGSSVGRTGPNCEFAECPEGEIANWKKYRNEQYGFEIKYKPDLSNGKINEFQSGWWIGLPDIKSFLISYCDNCPPSGTVAEKFDFCQYYIVVGIFDNTSKLSLNDWFEKYSKNFGYSNQVKEEVLISGIKGIKTGQLGGLPPGGGNIDALALISKGSLIYSINLNIDQEVLSSNSVSQCLASGGKLFNQMLSTFKFIQ